MVVIPNPKTETANIPSSTCKKLLRNKKKSSVAVKALIITHGPDRLQHLSGSESM
jgi:hypothetical protein